MQNYANFFKLLIKKFVRTLDVKNVRGIIQIIAKTHTLLVRKKETSVILSSKISGILEK